MLLKILIYKTSSIYTSGYIQLTGFMLTLFHLPFTENIILLTDSMRTLFHKPASSQHYTINRFHVNIIPLTTFL